jgi:hypothetical protein
MEKLGKKNVVLYILIISFVKSRHTVYPVTPIVVDVFAGVTTSNTTTTY